MTILARTQLASFTDTGHPKERADSWGPWRLDRATRTLYATYPRTGNLRYEVDLDDCLTSARVLDWICQIAGKDWADDKTLAGLVRALDDVLHPQAHLCSMGSHTTITKRRIAELVARARIP